MPLYELVYLLSLKVDKARQAAVMVAVAKDVLSRSGVVRKLSNEGICEMQYRMARHGVSHDKGRYVHMLFDASSDVVEELTDTIGRTRPEIFRWVVTLRGNDVRSTLSNPEDVPMDFQTDVGAVAREVQRAHDTARQRSASRTPPPTSAFVPQSPPDAAAPTKDLKTLASFFKVYSFLDSYSWCI